MIILIKLIIAHIIGDFLLQPQSWVRDKENRKARSPKLYLHIILHGLLVLFFLWDLRYWFLALSVMLSHGVIDVLKLYAQKESNKPKWFLIDQGLHVLCLSVLWVLFFKPDLNLHAIAHNTNSWIFVTAILFLTTVTGIIMRELMSNWSKALQDGNEASLHNAGKYIGILERLFIFIFIITDHWEGIGFLLAAKSIFRFGDLKESKDRKLTEYILIGTLLSFGIAVVTGVLALKLMAL